MNPEGLITQQSRFDLTETVGRVEAELAARGVEIFARIDHSAAAAKVGLDLDPTIVFVFGNPRVGTRLMQAEQTFGIDLPMKLLVWQDAERRTWLGYDDPLWLGERHGVALDEAPTLTAMAQLLAGLVAKTAC